MLFLLMLLVADDIRRDSAPLGWVALALLGGAGLYTIPVTLYPMGVVLLWLLLDLRNVPADRRGRRITDVALAGVGALALATLLYLPIIRSAGLSALTGNKFVQPSTWLEFALELPGFVTELFETWVSPLPPWTAWVLLALALWRTLSTASRRRGGPSAAPADAGE